MGRLTIGDLEIERNDDPFEVEMADGTVFTFRDPKAIQWTGLVAFDPTKPAQALSLVLGDEQYAAFSQRDDVDGYFLEAVFKKYMEHYRLAPPGEAAASSR